MPSKRTFHRYVFQFEVLSEEELGDVDLTDLDELTTHGDCSGRFLETKHDELNGEEAAEALVEQGSDPEFFQLDENGNDLNDEA